MGHFNSFSSSAAPLSSPRCLHLINHHYFLQFSEFLDFTLSFTSHGQVVTKSCCVYLQSIFPFIYSCTCHAFIKYLLCPMNGTRHQGYNDDWDSFCHHRTYSPAGAQTRDNRQFQYLFLCKLVWWGRYREQMGTNLALVVREDFLENC